MLYILKKAIKKILRYLGFKLITLGPPHTPNPYGKVDLETLDCMIKSNGILHLGAHRGTEAEVYNWFGKKTIWFEAVPHIYDQLKDNLYFYSDQKAFLALLGDEDDSSCLYSSYINFGCIYENAINFDPSANVDDGSCEYMFADINSDGIINILDIVQLVNIILN